MNPHSYPLQEKQAASKKHAAHADMFHESWVGTA